MGNRLKSGVFRKRSVCPSSQVLLAYTAESLARRSAKRVKTHLGQCDFCRAEARLLMSNPPPTPRYAPARMPLAVWLLAQKLLML